MTGLRLIILFVCVAIPSSAKAAPPPADDAKHYILLFGGQAERLRPQTAHTWATFVKAVPNPKGGVVIEQFTISWLPERLPVRPFKIRPVSGRNYGLAETLELFDNSRSDYGLWGPYEIREDWYRSAALHKQFLDSGSVRFATLDRGKTLSFTSVRRPDISHCVHALTRTWEPLRKATNPVNWYGEFITRRVAESSDDVGLLVNSKVTHDWLIEALGADQHPFVRRRLGEPRIAILR